MAHYSRFIEESISHALATAGRAITILSQRPFYVAGTIAVVDQERCVGCLTCVRTCPFHIPKIDILKAFEAGADGVYVVGCPLGNCHHVRGNERADARVQRTKKLLDEIGLGGDRLDMYFGRRRRPQLCRHRPGDDGADPGPGAESLQGKGKGIKC